MAISTSVFCFKFIPESYCFRCYTLALLFDLIHDRCPLNMANRFL